MGLSSNRLYIKCFDGVNLKSKYKLKIMLIEVVNNNGISVGDHWSDDGSSFMSHVCGVDETHSLIWIHSK